MSDKPQKQAMEKHRRYFYLPEVLVKVHSYHAVVESMSFYCIMEVKFCQIQSLLIHY